MFVGVYSCLGCNYSDTVCMISSIMMQCVSSFKIQMLHNSFLGRSIATGTFCIKILPYIEFLKRFSLKFIPFDILTHLGTSPK